MTVRADERRVNRTKKSWVATWLAKHWRPIVGLGRRPSVSNIIVGLSLLYLGTCAYTASVNARDTITVAITASPRPMGRDPKTVRFWCNGHLVSTIHNVSTVSTTRARVPLDPSCRRIQFSVETYGGDMWASEGIFVEPDDRIDIKIQADLYATYFMVYH